MNYTSKLFATVYQLRALKIPQSKPSAFDVENYKVV